MAHVSRKFVDIFAAKGSSIAEEAIKRIAKLYKVEKEARGKSPEERAALRQTEAKPIFDNLEEWLHAQLPKISGRSPLAKAIRYALGRMPKAPPYLEDSFLELHSNIGDAGQNCRSLRSHQRPVYEPPKLEDASQATLQNLLQ